MNTTSKTWWSACALTALLGLAGLSDTAAAKSLTVGHTGTQGNSVYVYFDVFARELEKRSGGSLTANVHPSGELGGDDQLIQSAKLGTIDVMSAASANMGTMTNAYLWTDLPYVFKSREAVEEVLSDPQIAGIISDKVAAGVGTRVLGYIQVGGFRMLENTKRALKTPDDAKGLKFRVTASPIDVALIRAWGGLPTPVAWAETFTAVQQGVVDGLNLQPSWTALAGFGQVIKHATQNRAVISLHVAQMNLDSWNSLSEEEQGWVMQAAVTAQTEANAADAKSEAGYLETLTQQGVEIYEPMEQELAAWREAAIPVWDEMKDKIDPAILAKLEATQSK